MDIDANDILSTNVFIKEPKLNNENSRDNVDEFKRYYEDEIKKQDNIKLETKVNKISLRDITHDEYNDENNNYSNIDTNSQPSKNITRDIKLLQTLVSIDSRDRTKTSNLKANNFSIFLNKTFRNVKEIELVSLEFPNTHAVINSNNNMIYWRNKEDIDYDITVTVKGQIQYPIYSAQIVIGSYTLTSLQSAIVSVTNVVTRRQGTQLGSEPINQINKYHFFVIDLDINTDLVKFYSLIMTNLPNNCLTSTASSGLISVNAPLHGYSSNQTIYISGSQQISGIDSGIINGFQIITVLNTNTFTFTVNVQAATSTNGGGNAVKSGKFARFQFLWGVEPYTVAQNIGYPLENSSQLITTNISNMQNIFQMIITIVQNTGFTQTYDYIGQTISIGYITTSPIGVKNFIGYATYQITNILSGTEILVEVTDNTVYQTLLNNSVSTNTMQFGSQTYDIFGYSIYTTPSVLINTQTYHNYLLSDIGTSITLSGTDTFVNNATSNINGTYVINQLPTSTSIIVPGLLNYSVANGNIPRNNPLSTWTILISSITPNYMFSGSIYYSLITTTEPHLLYAGDQVQFNNIVSVPILTNSYTITSVTSSTSFLIAFKITSIDNTNIILKKAFISTGLITVSFPSHGFNNIIGISDGPDYTVTTGVFTITDTNMIITTYNVSTVSTGTVLNGTMHSIRIQTLNPHYLSVGKIVRLTFIGTQPTMTNGNSLTGGGYEILTVPTADSFTIINRNTAFKLLNTIPTNLSGIMGLSNSFYIYGCPTIGGIDQSIINSINYTVRDIYDINTFTFMSTGFATSISVAGGSKIYISSLLHGYSGTQANTKNNELNRSINLEGENYCFLTCSDLNTMLNTGTVKNVFARISLDQPPGYVCYSFLSNPKIFDIVPLDILEILTFSVKNYDGTNYEFNDLDYSFTLKITESVDYTNLFNISSRRGITDTTSVKK